MRGQPPSGLWTLCLVSIEMAYQWETRPPEWKSLRTLRSLKEYAAAAAKSLQSCPTHMLIISKQIPLCLSGHDHRPIDKYPLFNYLGLWHMNHGLTLIRSLFYLAQTSFKEFGEVGLSMYTKGFHKNWSGSLAKRRLCLGPASVINCTPLSALSFWVSLFSLMCGCNSRRVSSRTQSLTLTVTCSGTMGMLINLYIPQFPYL